MGRTEPSKGLAPPSFRRDARAKKAKATLNKAIPALLSSHPRAKRGTEASELIVEPPARKSASNAPRGGERNGAPLPPNDEQPGLFLEVADTLAVARSLLRDQETERDDLSNRVSRVAILNMASPLSPGGGFVNGASSQEESLCMRSTLLPSLKDEFYRLPELGAVFTPDVLVFRNESGDDLEKRDRWFVDCVSAAMLRMPETEVNEESGRGRYVNSSDRDTILQKMRIVMRVFQAKGARKVVLGAWGCGAYGNPVGEIAAAWSKVLLGGKNKAKAKKETWSGIDEVVFAIKDPGLADGFEAAFGPGLTRRAAEDASEEESENDDAEAFRLKELQDKISELEQRMAQTANAQVKSGLGGILAGLKSQLGGVNDKDAPTPDRASEASSDEAASDQDSDVSSPQPGDEEEAEDGDHDNRR
ncbi:hypothetical protein PFICI_14038 [Pestalotiopsis fici W106-1]|uniref:Microbial-type PARG catalytic domain-containing protein n=1 Tax=Pestalotiopsis fici (strain W106-1 / CGMCC3.15140) TaxID=1229662 RepID=W3WLX2_PESFW|nr:uncharacterized protein PFICI_14038 [Pestalotiopsis fici W106-1]ETS74172.1 hypothetical protein PFICI_14038 [Pestalotiopsis fici W106-1]